MEQVGIYCIIIVLFILCLFSAVLFRVLHLYGNITKFFLFIFCILSILNVSEYKNILSDTLTESFLCIIAVTLISCISYITVIFFGFGRDFVKHIKSK